jgi:precorrin-6B C5,15-methyltransferase / cobalt-precorrin-6B C5,C15-methyltransferase
MTHALFVVGIGHDGLRGLSPDARARVETARVLAGGRRHLQFVPQFQGEKLLLESDVSNWVEQVKQTYRQKKTVVLASGDPLFFGIGRALLDAMPRDELVFLPHISSVQLAFARIKETWHDAHIVSVHGRPLDALIAPIEERAPKIAVLTDPRHGPAAIAGLLRQLGSDTYVMWVCENLGGPDERVSCHRPEAIRDQVFAPLNLVVLLREEQSEPNAAPSLPLLGIPETALLPQEGSRGMITRREVRLLAICYLELRPGEVLWDIGAGSGSVALEAARLSAHLQVFAIEHDAEAYAQLAANCARFGNGRVHAVCAEAPEGCAAWPAPDAVFIGGSGGRLDEILEAVAGRLKAGGRIVLNCITLENFARGWDKLQALGLEPEASSVQLAHSRPLGRWHSMAPENPIMIVRARKT